MTEKKPTIQTEIIHGWNPVTPVAAVAGFGLTSYGAALIYYPLGFIVAGVLLLALAIKEAQP